MTKRLKISVSVPDKVHTGKLRELFRNTIECDSAVSVSFQKLIDAFEILYPYNDLIINFTLL